MNKYNTLSDEQDDDEFVTPRSSMISNEDDYMTPPQSEYETPRASYDDNQMAPLEIQQKQLKGKITKQQIEKNNPMGFGKYKDCSKMNIDVITDPRELHARYQACCPYRQTPLGTWKTKTPFCIKLDKKYKEKANEINKPMINKFNAVSVSDLSRRDTDLSTVDNNVLKGGSRKRRRSATKKRNKLTPNKKRRSNKSKRNKSKRNKRSKQ